MQYLTPAIAQTVELQGDLGSLAFSAKQCLDGCQEP